MKITVAKQDLEAALSVTRLTVSGDADLSGHYLFRFKDGKAEVMSYHQRLFSRAPITGAQVEGAENDAFTVEAWRLDKWVGGVGDGVLTLSAEGTGDVIAAGSRSKIKLRSLDPSKFPFWDKLVALATSSGTVLPAALGRALNVSRWFVSADDTSKPELCQIDSIGGVLWATDRRALSSVEVPGIEKLSMRIPGKDVPPVVRFLNEKSADAGQLVELREAQRPPAEGGGAALFVRPDGSYIGVSRPGTQLPALKVNRDAPDAFTINLDHAEFTAGISVLSASAPKGHEAISFKLVDGVVHISMPCEAGGADEYPLTNSTVENPAAFTMEFVIDYPYIQGLVGTFGLNKIALGCTKRDQGGYCSFRHLDNEEDRKAFGERLVSITGKTPDEIKALALPALTPKENRYHTVIVWRT